jgi:hypothetical protein
LSGAVHTFLTDDHTRLDALLRRAVASVGVIDYEAYQQFRAGLLRHIAMEEKVLFPEARLRRSGEALPIWNQLRADHAALAALLVPSPTPEILAVIRDILEGHNQLEEQPAGVYELCEELAGTQAGALLGRLRAVPEVKVARHFDGPRAHAHIASLLKARATQRT